MPTFPTITLTENASKLAKKGHPWFFADDIATGTADHGAFVQALAHDRRELGVAFFAKGARLVLRLTGVHDVHTPEAFFAATLGAAIARRERWRTPRAGLRLLHGDADGVPGLVVDQYADVLVVQVTSGCVERHLDSVVPFLVERLAPRMILARNDVSARRFEGLREEVLMLHGDRVEEVEIEEGGIVHVVQPWGGHKTGFYLDQRPARARVRALAQDANVLDVFAYQGGFALSALAGGAKSALAIDQSESALALAVRGAERNRLLGLETSRANAFAALRDLRSDGKTFDLVIIDPPAFAKSKSERAGGARGYRDLNHVALRLLADGGHLVTCSCSHHIDLPLFETLVRQAAVDLPFKVVLRDRLGAGPDHPAWMALPESEYLKVLVVQRIG